MVHKTVCILLSRSLAKLTRIRSTSNSSTINTDNVGGSPDVRSQDGFVVVDASTTSKATCDIAEDTPAPDADVIISDHDARDPICTPQSPSVLDNTDADAGSNFIAMTEPSVESIANAKIEILRNNIKLQEEHIEGYKQEIQALLNARASQRQVDRSEYDRKLEAQMQVHREESGALTQKYLTAVHEHCHELQGRDKDRKAEIKKLEQVHAAEIQALKQKHDAEVDELKQQHEAEIARLEHSQAAKFDLSDMAADKLVHDHTAKMEKLQKDAEAKLQQHQDAVSELEDKIVDLEQHHMAILSAKERSHNADLESLEQTRLNMIEKVAGDYDAQVETLKQSQEALVRSYEVKLRDLKAEHEAMLGALAADMIGNAGEATQMHTKEIADIKVKHQTELKKVKQDHERSTFADRQIHKAEVNELRSQIETLEDEVESVKKQSSKYKRERDSARMHARGHADALTLSPPYAQHTTTSSAAMPPLARNQNAQSNPVNQAHGRQAPPRSWTHQEHLQLHIAYPRPDCEWCLGDFSPFHGY